MESFTTECVETLKAQDNQIEELVKDIKPQGLNWRPKQDTNSIYMLVTHIIGSRNFWINQVIGGRDIHRDRDAEFKAWGQDIPKLLSNLRDVSSQCINTMENLRPDDHITKREIRGKEYSIPWCLLHTVEHSGYHIGQIQLLKKQLNQNGGQV